MNTFFKFIFLILMNHLNSSFARSNIEQNWLEWKIKHNKTYNNSTHSNRLLLTNHNQSNNEAQRYQVFKENMLKITKHNNRSNTSYLMDTNAYSDLTLDELNTRFLAVIDVNQLKQFNMISNKTYYNKTKSIAKRIDWVKSGYVAKIRNQGVCGACYTFATIASIESAYAIKNNLKNEVVGFSEQQLLDCTYFTYGYNNFGCNGGYAYSTLLYTYYNGLELSQSYPYIGKRSTCNHSPSKVYTRTSSIDSINYRDIATIKQVLNKQPIIAHMYVGSDFYFYKSGIYSSTSKSCQAECHNGVNHMVTLVGYDKDNNGTNYWIVRNHWGETWGEKGYFRIEMGKNMCCIEGFEYYPTV